MKARRRKLTKTNPSLNIKGFSFTYHIRHFRTNRSNATPTPFAWFLFIVFFDVSLYKDFNKMQIIGSHSIFFEHDDEKRQ